MSIPEKRFWTEGIKEGRKLEREEIIKLIKDTYEAEEFFELGSFVWTTDIIELIEGKKNEV
jgi:hypothetical protein